MHHEHSSQLLTHHGYSLPFVQDGVMIPFSKDIESEMKHSLKQVGKKYIFTVKSLNPEDAGIYQVDVEGVNIFSTDFKRTFFLQHICLFVS